MIHQNLVNKGLGNFILFGDYWSIGEDKFNLNDEYSSRAYYYRIEGDGQHLRSTSIFKDKYEKLNVRAVKLIYDDFKVINY